MNARFHAWINGGLVTLTIRPDRSLTHTTGGPTDEGYAWFSETWALGETDDGRPAVLRSYHKDACDCDGRLSSGGTLICPLGRLRTQSIRGHMYPDWQTQEQYQRDYQAEAAGY